MSSTQNPTRFRATCIGKTSPEPLVKARASVYRHAHFQTMVRSSWPLRQGNAGLLTVRVEQSHGRTKTKNLPGKAWHAPLGRRAEGADLCRGQEFRRDAPAAPHRPEDRHVSRPSGAGAQGAL